MTNHVTMSSISVIIPVYRGRATIGRAINSVNSQTAPPVEVIVVDNEPDPELEVFIPLSRWPMRFLREARKGAAFARNLGLASAKGTHCAFLDCDDEWDGDYLQAMSRAIKENPGAWLFASTSLVLLNDRAHLQRPPNFGKDAVVQLLLYNAITTSGVVANTAGATQCGGFFEGLALPASCEDWALWLKLLRHGYGVAVPDAMVVRHETSSNARHDGNSAFYRDIESAAKHALGEHPAPRLVRAARAGILLRRGTEYLRDGRRGLARGCFRAAVKLFPSSARIWAWLAVALIPSSFERSARKFLLTAILTRSRKAEQWLK